MDDSGGWGSVTGRAIGEQEKIGDENPAARFWRGAAGFFSEPDGLVRVYSIHKGDKAGWRRGRKIVC